MSSLPNRIWLFRTLAVLVGLSPFLLAEVVLRVAGYPRNPPAVDPFVDLHNLKRLFDVDPEKPDELRISPDRLNLFRPASFRRIKEPGSFRVFALGGSTTQGEPYSTETAFPAWLEVCLETATQRDVEVINCGGLSYASYRVLAILREVLLYSPDLIVVYTGHNEFLERRSYEGYELGSLKARASSWVNQLHLVQLIKKGVGRDGQRVNPLVREPTELTTEVEALLDYAGGLEDYHRNDPWRGPVVEHFRWNLQQMIAECRSSGIDLIMVRPVSNLLDCPPLKFETAENLDIEARTAFDERWKAARSAESPEEALAEVLEALEIDPRHAGANFLLGKLLFSSGNFAEAKLHLTMARDNDVCPLRAITEIVDSVTEICRIYDVPMVDAEQLFSEQSEAGIVGNHWLVDHIHPGIDGHQVLGQAIAAACFQNAIFREENRNWEEQIANQFQQKLASLGEEYFHRGRQRLEGLMLWAQGRAKKLRPDSLPEN